MNCLKYAVRLFYDINDLTAGIILNIEAAKTSRQHVVDEQLALPPSIAVTRIRMRRCTTGC